MVPPDSAFQAHTRSRNFSRPMSRRDGLLPLHQLPLDHHLGCDAGMVGAGLPQHVLAAHPLEPAQNILKGVVERMPHVQRAGHVRRRDHDAVGRSACALGAAGAERLRLFPGGVNAAFDLGGLVGFVDHRDETSRFVVNLVAR